MHASGEWREVIPRAPGVRAGWGGGLRCRNGSEAGNREWRKGPRCQLGAGGPRGGVGGGCSLPRRGVPVGGD